METKPHIAIVPSPGMGHLFPLIELAKRLVQHHNFCATFIIPTAGPPSNTQISALENLPDAINHVFLPPVSFEDLPKDVSIETKLSLTVARSLSFIHDVVKSLLSTVRLVALFVDLFSTDAFAVANDFNLSPYLFFGSAHFSLSLSLSLPKLDETVTCEFGDMPEPVIRIPGCSVPVHARDLPQSLQDKTKDAYKSVLHSSKSCFLAEGIVVNSFNDLGEEVIKDLQEKEHGKPPVYPIGPLVRSSSSSGTDASNCLEWLDHQPSCSVLFVSFGSVGTLSFEQINELALGLEMSEQRFLWVVRSPDNISASSSYFSVQSNAEPFGFLPRGFLERTKAKGLLLSSWAPQIEVLSHASTAGFLSHCGWNSTLESIVHGVPLIAWPLFAEQNLNALMLNEDLQVAMRPKAQEDELVGREEIAKVVKGLLQSEEGFEIRERMNKLKDAAANAMAEEGSSTKSLSQLVSKLKGNI